MVSLKSLVLNLLRIRSFPKGQVQVGMHTSGNPTVLSYVQDDRVIIGKFCSVAVDVMLIPSFGHLMPKGYEEYRVCTYGIAGLKKSKARAYAHYGRLASYALPGKPGCIVVGNDVWLGARSIILSGVRIGDGAVVGAGSVVTHDVPPYAVVAGNPARLLRYRCNEEQIRKLLEIAWWDWPIKKILENTDYFYGGIDDFVKKFWEERH